MVPRTMHLVAKQMPGMKPVVFFGPVPPPHMCQVRFYSSTSPLMKPLTTTTNSPESCPFNQASKPFKAMPGPNPLPFIWNLWRYFPIIGQYQLEKMDRNGRYNLAKYGKIMREEITASHRIVHLFDPSDMESMFAQEDRYPCRRSHRALLKYRRDRPDTYQSGGIFPENGEEWARLRSLFKRHFLVGRNVNAYDTVLDQISGDLVQYVRATRNQGSLEVADFQEDLYRWALESICAIMLDSRIGCLGVNLSEQSDPSRLIRAAHQTIHAVMRTELYSSWESRETSDYRELVAGQDVMAEIVGKHMDARIAELKAQEPCNEDEEETSTLLTQFVRNPDISRKDMFAMVIDSVLAGIDTTSITAAFALYFLARHPEYQDKLRAEVQQALGSDTQIKATHLTSMPWLKAIVKETLRLRPVSIGVGRLTTTPVEIGGYQIPPNTMIITQNQVSCQLDEYFREANRFMPERWMMDRTRARALAAQMKEARAQAEANGEKWSVKSRNPNRYLWLPFGHGTRMCLGRRIAELEIYMLLCKLVTNFKIEYNHEDVGVKTMLINLPDRAMKFKFVDL